MNSNNRYSEWGQIKDMLKEKFGTKNTASVNSNDISGNDSWNKFQQITGKTKEQIQTELRTF